MARRAPRHDHDAGGPAAETVPPGEVLGQVAAEAARRNGPPGAAFAPDPDNHRLYRSMHEVRQTTVPPTDPVYRAWRQIFG